MYNHKLREFKMSFVEYNELAPVLNAVKVPILAADKEGVVILCNSSSERYFGDKLKTGSRLFSFLDIPPDDFKKAFEEVLSGNEITFSDITVLPAETRKVADLSVSFLETEGDGIALITVKDSSLGSRLFPGIGKLKATVESSPSSILITDRNGIVEYVNGNFEKLTGYSLDDIKGKNADILKPEFFSKDNRGMWEEIRKGNRWKGEFLNAKKNGELYWAIVSISPLYGKDGSITHYLSIQEDVTYLKKKEEELKQSEEKLRLLFESLPEGILVTDLDGNIMQVNRAYLRIFGYSDRIMLSGRNIHHIFEEAGEHMIVELFSLAVKNGCSGIAGYELQRDETVYIDLQALMISDEDGAPQGFLILAEDVSDRNRAERALRESEARNRALVDAIPDIMFRMSNEGVYLDKMLGTKINEIFPPDVAADAVRHIGEAISTREIQIYEYPVIIGMEERYYEARFVAIEDNEVLIIIRNTTEKRKALDEIEKARREAELANRAKSEFLANMSHEIRTPLNSITGFIELLMRTKIDGAQKEYLEIIKKSASNLLELINDILDFSKIESHKLEISPVEFDPYTEFESVIRLFNVKAQEKGINLISFIDPLLPSGIKSDPLRLKQVMSNFLSNAIKFTPDKGTVIAEIKLFRVRDDVCMINFSVSDTGIGIPERKQKQIFEAFTQADNSVTRRYGGSGLGLSICSNLVKLMGSEIVVESRMGIGSKFYFTIEAEISRERTMKDSFPSCAGLNACIVSYSVDDIALLNLEYYLQSFGFNITFVPEFDRCRADRFDILFVINSEEAMRSAGNHNHAALIKSVPAILISGSSCGEPPDEIKGLFRHFLSQPLSPEMLARSAIGIIGMEPGSVGIAAECSEHGTLKFSGKVLIGEDNRINQKLMTLLLKDYGVDVQIAGNGLDVFDLFKKGGFDLVFMDINMPVADGIETARMILDYEGQMGLPHVPIVALTAKVLKSDMETMSECGMDGFLLKPVEMDRLESVLARYLTIKIAGDDLSDGCSEANLPDAEPVIYDIKSVAAELRIPVNVLESIGRDFFEESAHTVVELRRAYGESDLEMVRILSHKMKGAAANLRFAPVSELLSAVEENSSAADKEFDYAAYFDNIESELSVLQSFFR